MSDNLDHAEIRAAAAALRQPLMPESGGLHAAAWNIAGYVDALLDNIAELEAHPPMLVDLGAEQRGYDKAVANLRDSDRFVTWAFKHRPPTALMADVCAEYLEAVKETPDAV